VITAYEGDAVWIADFEGEEQQKSFDRVKAPINKVACVW
jgi:hypothetical protein